MGEPPPPKSPSRAAQQWAVSLIRGRNDEGRREAGLPPFQLDPGRGRYIIPPMSGMPAPAPALSFSGGSATIASVVRMFFAIDAAFCSAERVTMVGSITPAFTRSPYSPV